MKRDHLPIYGVGPVYGAVIILLTALGIALTSAGQLPRVGYGFLRLPLAVVGAALIIFGAWLWYGAVFRARVDRHIRENTLATTGVYAWVRNPIYSALLLACTGALLLADNLWLLVLPPVDWVCLTILMKCTEERWLVRLHGEEYTAYCRRVNRCIPWFPGKDRGDPCRILRRDSAARSALKAGLHSKRVRTEAKIRALEREGRAGMRYTATIPDIPFLIVGLICDAGWMIHLIAGVAYFLRYRFHAADSAMRLLDVLALASMAVVVFGVIMVIHLDRIHEKEIATRLQKNLSFGATIFGGLVAGAVGVFQWTEAGNLAAGEAPYLIWMAAGGFLNFAFGLPIFASFRKGIRYSDR